MKIYKSAWINRTAVLWIAVVVITLLSRGEALASKALANTADLLLNQILWREGAFWRSPSPMLLAAKLYQRVPSDCTVAPAELQEHQASEYLAMATQTRRYSHAPQTAEWLYLAAQSAEPRAHPLMIPGDISVNESGNLLLNLESPRWQLRPDSDPTTVDVVSPKHLILSLPNNTDHRETTVYSWHGPFNADRWQTLSVRLRGSPDLLFTLEVHSQSKLHRHINYQSMSGDWQEFSVPLIDPTIEYIYLTFKEAESHDYVTSFSVELTAITLED